MASHIIAGRIGPWHPYRGSHGCKVLQTVSQIFPIGHGSKSRMVRSAATVSKDVMALLCFRIAKAYRPSFREEGI